MHDKILYVSKDRKKNPIVRVDPVVLGKAKMKWRRDSDSPEYFDFVDIVFEPPEPFTDKSVSNSKISVTNNLTSGNYKYTITVRCHSDKKLYTTTELKPSPLAPGDKPVIRN